MAPKWHQKHLSAQRECIRRYSQKQVAQDPTHIPTTSLGSWQDGDIAFLKSHTEFSKLDYRSLIDTDYLHPGATNHPVLILSRPSKDSTHVIITPITAFGSGPENNYLPPWRQERLWFKNPEYFRSFQGSEQFDKERKLLQLRDGKLMPKPKTSWLDIQSVFVVPITVLKTFNKPPTKLCMTPESLDDLLAHIQSETIGYDTIMSDTRLDLRFTTATPTKKFVLADSTTTSWSKSSPKMVERTTSRSSTITSSSIVRKHTTTATTSSRQPWGSTIAPRSWASLLSTTSSTITNDVSRSLSCHKNGAVKSSYIPIK